MAAGYTGPPDIDHRERADRFHRRAQKAEAALAESQAGASYWFSAWKKAIANRNTLRTRLRRTQGKLRATRMAAIAPLERIIEMGRLFP